MNNDCIQSFKKRLKEIENSPDLRYFMNQHIVDIKTNQEVKNCFEKQLKHLRKNWFPKDKFRQGMIDDLEFDYEIELDKPLPDKAQERKFEEEFLPDSRCEIYHKRDFVNVSINRNTENLIEEVTYETIRKILNMFDGNRTEAVKVLGISIRTLTKYISQYKALGLIEVDYEKKKKSNPLEKELPKAQRKKDKSEGKFAICHPKQIAWQNGLCFKCWRKQQEYASRPMPKANCHPDEFEWEKGLCFKCWKNT